MENPKRMSVAYANLDDKYGMLMVNYYEQIGSCLRGHDQRAYDRLIVIAEENREK